MNGKDRDAHLQDIYWSQYAEGDLGDPYGNDLADDETSTNLKGGRDECTNSNLH